MITTAFVLLQASGGLGSMGLILPIALVGMMLLTILPNRNRQKKWQTMLGELKPGDTVTTNGGIRGVILNVKDDSLTLRVAPDNIKLEFVKTAIASVTTNEEAK